MTSPDEKLPFRVIFYDLQPVEEQLKKCIDELFRKPVLIIGSKSIENAAKFSLSANNALSKKEYEMAIKQCTRGLQESVPYCELSSVLYSTRAKALGCLQMYEEGLIDIDRAIEISLNTELTKLLKDTKMDLEKKAHSHPKQNNRNHFEDIPSLSHSENEHVPGMSDAVRLVYTKEHGLNFEATKPIGFGDVILIEKPQVTTVLKTDGEFPYLCNHCLIRRRALLPCERCNNALYCSKECRAKAYEEYHRFQCNSKNFTCIFRFVIRLLMKITENGEKLTEAIKYCKELDKRSGDAMELSCKIRDNLGDNLKSVLNLSMPMQKDDHRDAKNVFQAAYMALYLRNQTNYMRGYNDIFSIAKLIFRLYYIYDRHAFQKDLSVNSDGPSRVYNLYSVLSWFRHSCCANTVFTIHKNGVIAVRAAKDFKPGEKLTFNFIHISKWIPFLPEYIPRKIVLRNEKGFVCKCPVCVCEDDLKPEFGSKLKIPKELGRRLRKKRFDIDSLWELLKLINNESSRPCLEAELLKAALSDIYLGKRITLLDVLYRLIGLP